MRIIILGNLNGNMTAAVSMANQDGGRFDHADSLAAAATLVRSKGVGLLLIEANMDIKKAIKELGNGGMAIPVIAFGIGEQPQAAAVAVKAGARKYLPLPESPESIAVALLVLADRRRQMVGRTVAEVEQDLILETLRHCIGNRTRAADILGISIRTLRNKLNQYSADGFHVPSPGEAREISLY